MWLSVTVVCVFRRSYFYHRFDRRLIPDPLCLFLCTYLYPNGQDQNPDLSLAVQAATEDHIRVRMTRVSTRYLHCDVYSDGSGVTSTSAVPPSSAALE